MKEIVDTILKEEEQARKRIEKVRLEAQDIVLKAQKDSADFTEQTITEVNTLAEKKKNDSLEEFIAQKEKVIREAREQFSAKRQAKNKDIPGFAQKIFSRIIEIK
jgi:vacuolar-type H+-ATPase subunit H